MPAPVALPSADQLHLLDLWLPGAEVVHDHSWGQVERAVREVVHAGRRYIVKAGGPDDHHMAREIRAHQSWLQPWTSLGRAPLLAFADLPTRLLVTHHLSGRLVLGTEHEHAAATYRQAGKLLALLHRQGGTTDEGHEARENRRTLAWLDSPHRIAGDVVARLRRLVASWPTPSTTLVPTHGDWQPRNWLVDDDGVVSIIDFGRAALRPAMTDLARLQVQQFRGRPDLERAFLEGYGADPREPGAWHRTLLREAVSTAAWAHQVGDEEFEAQGLRMVDDALAAISA
ncbi:phosphotransferase [Phycicoccus sp. Soil748]|uniref:phosphotransferase n=1 Tax=Phycicoccus sp. Soil748 TaxID=1736397 RepID=UPI000A4D2793|nr:phosphotransferase [Phycicoccus sp. Soil748]